MKEVMYTYNYHQRRALMRQPRNGSRVFFWVICCAVLYAASTVVYIFTH